MYSFKIGSGLSSGNAKTFYENYTLNEILPFVKVDTKSDDYVRTIHSTKGAEFENILVHFEAINEFREIYTKWPKLHQFTRGRL